MSDAYREWLHSALMDLRSIEKILNDPFLTPVACFHSHWKKQSCFFCLPRMFTKPSGYTLIRGADIKANKVRISGEIRAMNARIPARLKKEPLLEAKRWHVD